VFTFCLKNNRLACLRSFASCWQQQNSRKLSVANGFHMWVGCGTDGVERLLSRTLSLKAADTASAWCCVRTTKMANTACHSILGVGAPLDSVIISWGTVVSRLQLFKLRCLKVIDLWVRAR
jgi:hypothetical protein